MPHYELAAQTPARHCACAPSARLLLACCLLPASCCLLPAACCLLRLAPTARAPLVVSTDSSVSNTWQANLTGRMLPSKATVPPAFVSASIQAAYVSAERDAARRDACVALRRHPPTGLVHPLRYPYLPMACCKKGTMRRHTAQQLLKPWYTRHTRRSKPADELRLA